MNNDNISSHRIISNWLVLGGECFWREGVFCGGVTQVFQRGKCSAVSSDLRVKEVLRRDQCLEVGRVLEWVGVLGSVLMRRMFGGGKCFEGQWSVSQRRMFAGRGSVFGASVVFRRGKCLEAESVLRGVSFSKR